MTEEQPDLKYKPKTKKVTFNCPIQIFENIKDLKEAGYYGSYTDAILTALREKFIKSE